LWLAPAVLAAAEAEDHAWDVLNHALADGSAIKRAEAITALGAMEPADHMVNLLEVGLSDKDAMVRTAAAAMLGEMQARPAIPRLKQALNDESAEVSFAAAQALWKMGDRSGRDILWAVLLGERKAGPKLIEGEMRDVKRKLHSPAELARIGINGAVGLFGPFSMGMWFAEDLMKDKGAAARVLSARLLGADTDPQSLKELEDSLNDKNPAVRAAVARALSQRTEHGEIAKLEPLLADGNDGVRYMAAAAIIRLSQPPPNLPAPPRKKARPSQPKK
jgi:HEAT repeat protein